MASQPANTNIIVRRSIRTRTRSNLNTSIKERTQRLGVQEVMVPGEEIDVVVTVDSAGTNAPGPNPAWRYGMPVTVVPRTRPTLAEMLSAAETTAADEFALDFPKQIVGTRHDRFLQNTAADAANDLHQEIRDNAPPPRGLLNVV